MVAQEYTNLIKQFLENNQTVERVLVVCFTTDTYDAYNSAVRDLVPE